MLKPFEKELITRNPESISMVHEKKTSPRLIFMMIVYILCIVHTIPCYCSVGIWFIVQFALRLVIYGLSTCAAFIICHLNQAKNFDITANHWHNSFRFYYSHSTMLWYSTVHNNTEQSSQFMKWNSVYGNGAIATTSATLTASPSWLGQSDCNSQLSRYTTTAHEWLTTHSLFLLYL